jgi:ABC-type transport system involved in cytochrome bd biosynthesis fused ATPase/permease subunit
VNPVVLIVSVLVLAVATVIVVVLAAAIAATLVVVVVAALVCLPVVLYHGAKALRRKPRKEVTPYSSMGE